MYVSVQVFIVFVSLYLFCLVGDASVNFCTWSVFQALFDARPSIQKSKLMVKIKLK